MTLEPDVLADRRRLKRHITVWRLIALVAIFAVVAVAVWQSRGPAPFRDHIARLTVDGLILDDPVLADAIAAAAKSRRVRALIVRIDSPGGTTVGGESLFRALREAAEDKPVVAVIGTLGTSAGYMVALAADHIVARETSITGSIGVLMETAEISVLLEILGISAETIRSAPLKGTPSLFESLTPEARAAAQDAVDDVYQWFVDLLAERRGLDRGTALALADGRIFTGRQAKALGLIDATGGEDEAIEWLIRAREIEPGLPIREIGPEESRSVIRMLTTLGRKTLFSERLRLDGLLSVWQPDH